ncbi:mannan endo-1,4-beta-mannosidase [Allocatelliglobosispora scoriae]|uniref:mannan endo-1,4-beta-mannosidase n=1 Tax=Allocatelliglobosispora scoriae TaxID=643052 RepID=A0A841BLD8_9ACTN|nr:cellulase family glycosylhydrolase [Allocatelliglobosispora scoriae]MBB5869907.1 mannan endo-1,4-beta-mannosidase [Allocatelliglobosispora scoriae]
MNRHRRPSTIAAIVAAMLGILAVPAAPAQAGGAHGFVTRTGTHLKLGSEEFRVAGSNNYYLMYKSRAMVDDVFADAAAADFNVIRTWGWLDIGNADGSNSIAGKQEGVYFQYWNGSSPAYNDGADGLERLDYVLYAARRAGVKLVIPFTNNWSDFGGMDQYVRWRGGSHHDDFYADPVIKGWYADWITHLLNRVNTLTGVKYKDDPTIMAWELANEPRCQGSGVYPTSASCTPAVTTAWADQLTRHVKSIDSKHLVGVGDEGFTCDNPGTDDWTTNCGPGMDYEALTRLPAVDIASLHLYPDGWGKTPAWGTEWITSHIQKARRLGKAVVVGEFGIKDKAQRNVIYRDWTEAVRKAGGNGFLYWILSGVQDDGALYPDYDGFTVYCPSPVCLTIGNAGDELRHGQSSRPPVADHDTAVTKFDTAVTLTPLANDIAYRTHLQPATLAVTGATGGTFAVAANGSVAFTPTSGFVGKAVAHYTVRDAAGRTSNVADLVVTVKPDPTAAIVVDSFEAGIGSWAPGNWQQNAGTLTPTTGFHTHGTAGLHVAAADGGWFGTTFTEPLNLSGKTYLKYDVSAGPAAGTSSTVALQVGPGWAWCQGSWTWVNQGTAATLQIDLFNDVSCTQADLAEVHGLLIYISPGDFDVDYIRAE